MVATDLLHRPIRISGFTFAVLLYGLLISIISASEMTSFARCYFFPSSLCGQIGMENIIIVPLYFLVSLSLLIYAVVKHKKPKYVQELILGPLLGFFLSFFLSSLPWSVSSNPYSFVTISLFIVLFNRPLKHFIIEIKNLWSM